MNTPIRPVADSAANHDLQAIASADEAHQVDRPHTLNSIAVECEVSKRSVQNWLRKAVDKYGVLGELREGARHFSNAEREQILEFASSRKAQQPKAAPTPSMQERSRNSVPSAERTGAPDFLTLPQIEAGEALSVFADYSEEDIATGELLDDSKMTLYRGNHRSQMEAPKLGGPRDLGQIRVPIANQSYARPMDLARAVIRQNNQLIEGMSADLHQRQQLLDETNEALDVIEQSSDNLDIQVQQYQIQSAVQDALLGQQSQVLKRKVGQQQRLGKPAPGPTPPPSA